MMGNKKKRKSRVSSDGKKYQPGKGKDESTSAGKEGEAANKKQSKSFPVPGLNNLGNTCFFNAVLQNLSQTHLLRQRMSQHLSVTSYSLSIPSGSDDLAPLEVTVKRNDEGAKTEDFAIDLYRFLVDMNGMSNRILNPRIIFNHVCKSAPRFNSYQQQDSHELLRYLLDALKSEEIQRRKVAILKSYGVCKKPDKVKTLTDDDKKAIKLYGMQASMMDTYLEDVFGGKLTSSITCHSCQTCTDMQEDILDLSLPIPSDKVLHRFPKSKRKPSIHSSDDDEGLSVQKGRGSRASLSKHQRKRQEKAEKKKAKGKNKQKGKYSLEEFNELKSDPPKLPKLEEETSGPGVPELVQQLNDITLEEPVNTNGDVIRTNALIDSSSAVTDAPINIPGSPAANVALQSEASGVTFNHNTSVPDSTIDKEHVQGEPPTPSVSIDVPEKEPEKIEDISNSAQTVDSSATVIDSSATVIDSSATVIDTGSIVLENEPVPLDLSIEIVPTEPSGATPVVAKQKPAPPEEDNLFSLQSCLRDFTSPEILKGTEKFCCNVCTEKARSTKSKGTAKKSKEESSPLSLAVSDQQQPEKLTEKLTVENKGTNNDEKVEFSIDSGMNSSSSSSESDRDDSRDIESTKESDDEETAISDREENESECDLVFTEATKQLLIDHPPRVLCIQLKRFTQLGRNLSSLQKNNAHIDFTFLLDIASYCTDKCTDYFDSDGRLMYSLYGVVIHGGSMRGGHYTAYVRVRSEIQLERLTVNKVTESETINSDNEHIETRSFDYTSMENSQWYYISDTQVSKASADDVSQSQAYLLFYERLPFSC
ncbi:PREDICTED: ubiquitin carboxyl-terminal hydrolase 16-like [Amphimedon queenslandica]|uniref:Ubiquitin carboxyl-terminal hydrolase n=1 Tax=Amphimedon queenslandica TaxID=400682 RepID=A0A1X7VIY6_AMPQE|nr:PREDICTED: ubiquitin carboxyl-terminal hydrolase 16-like [Amphimedon queenslandica]|eukprot:XP_003384106.2 PREDICTED: ubiquitin carboxyl-terminal hydrolase 16-like [Amphimedon queenslandica]